MKDLYLTATDVAELLKLNVETPSGGVPSGTPLLDPTTCGRTISGTVFEDVNYGGGIGRDLATAAADAYSFAAPPGSHTVRVVNDTVASSRPGSDGSELASQTYRTDGASEGVGDGARKVGGELPSNEDAAANAGAQTLASLQGTDLDADGVPEWTQSIVTVDSSGGDVSGIDFGFNFDVIVNTNDAGQGSLR